ncbi:MAG: CHAT domain-containing protein [Acidobacteriota bacterium]
MLHFATHALLSQGDPMSSALVLSPGAGGPQDGFLQAREIARLRLDADLVVLSACRTARGNILPGGGVEGLAQAFFQAGARSVVGTLWNVDDAETAAFMGAFYRHLGMGQGKAEALRRAKLDRRAVLPPDGPVHWAAFLLLGEPARAVALAEPGQVEPWWILALLTALLAGALALRRKRPA